MKKNCIILMLALMAGTVHAQQIPNWQNKDLAADSLFGISTEKAYPLLKDKKSKPVIVAVIDAGVDTLHENLRSVLWINPRKRKGDNGTYGWSYIGKVQYDNLELTRQVRQGDTTLKKELDKELGEAKSSLQGMQNFEALLDRITKKIGKPDPTFTDFQDYAPDGPGETKVRQVMLANLSPKTDFLTFKDQQLDCGIDHYHILTDYQLNTAYDPRGLVGDHYFDSAQRDYGSPDNNGPDPTHGTHVSGIIAGIHTGIAHDVRILAIRAVPDGDERDKDIANAIRYATDHGAKVINMSFGKPYSQDKKAVDEAVAYALKKDVLLVQAAGNDNKNIDSTANFPRRVSSDEAYIVVGASDIKGRKAGFSNYGKNSVDVFAPGVQIYSSVPGSKYDYFNGTSMAAPVVAGLAALIREYYPKLSAKAVKDIILRSAVPDGIGNYCLTGGIVNAYQAFLLCAKKRS